MLLPMAESAHGSLRIRNGLRHHAIRAVGQLVDPPQLLRTPGEGRQDDELAIGCRRQRAIGPRDRDFEVRRTGIAAGIRNRRDRPLLLRLHHVRRHAHIDGTRRPVGRNLRRFLRWYRVARWWFASCSGASPASTAGAAPAAAPSQSANRRPLHGKFEGRSRSRRLNLIGAFLEVLSCDRPSVAPQERPDIEHADAASIEIRLVMHGELLHAVAEIEQPEVAGTDVAAARPEKQLAASLEHVDADVVDEWPRHLARPAHANVVAGVRAGTARSMRHQQVVPPVAEDHDRRFAVDGDVDRLRRWIYTLSGLRIELDESNVAKVRPVGEPERAVRRITKHARVDGIAVLDAIGPDHRTAVLPLVVRRIRIERPADEQSDRGLWLRPRG